MVVSEALDAWSLGVLAIAVFTGVPAFDPFTPSSEVHSACSWNAACKLMCCVSIKLLLLVLSEESTPQTTGHALALLVQV